ncbi:hypothetical protein LIL_11020 [Leptospira interrogans serovar Linhai str. 56609]|nr:hypothetical protein LIL_11020 [Leptospira interrogans serovar Linhai str. 56609]
MQIDFFNVGTTTKLRFVCKVMWELLQITILRKNFKIVGTHIFRNFFLH